MVKNDARIIAFPMQLFCFLLATGFPGRTKNPFGFWWSEGLKQMEDRDVGSDIMQPLDLIYCINQTILSLIF